MNMVGTFLDRYIASKHLRLCSDRYNENRGTSKFALPPFEPDYRNESQCEPEVIYCSKSLEVGNLLRGRLRLLVMEEYHGKKLARSRGFQILRRV